VLSLLQIWCMMQQRETVGTYTLAFPRRSCRKVFIVQAPPVSLDEVPLGPACAAFTTFAATRMQGCSRAPKRGPERQFPIFYVSQHRPYSRWDQ
jgi:hypothetical protein